MSSTTQTNSRWNPRIVFIWFLVGMVVCALIIGITILNSSSITGHEFSPQTFQQRQFQYSRLPGTQLILTSTVYGTPRSSVGKSVLQYLPVSASQMDWQVADVKQSGVSETRPPQILWNMLNYKNERGMSFWDDWSQQNPELAKVFWPRVQELAIQERYEVILDVANLAQNETDAEQLDLKMKQTIDSN